jgi:hypothetical protein
MCLDCGCGEPNESHGDERHITLDTVRSAAAASGISESEAMENIAAGLRQMRGAQGDMSETSGE